MGLSAGRVVSGGWRWADGPPVAVNRRSVTGCREGPGQPASSTDPVDGSLLPARVSRPFSRVVLARICTNRSMNPATILIVDDEPANLSLLPHLLRPAYHDTFTMRAQLSVGAGLCAIRFAGLSRGGAGGFARPLQGEVPI